MNWHQRIQAAKDRGSFTEGDMDLAKDWTTCACGGQDKRIPRKGTQDEPNAPRDYDLYMLGIRFNMLVHAHDFDKAEHVLDRIDRRAGEILAELDLSKT